jgi:hypothetical protein
MRINHLRTNTEENVLQDNVSKNKKKLQIIINEHEINSVQNLQSNFSNKKIRK